MVHMLRGGHGVEVVALVMVVVVVVAVAVVGSTFCCRVVLMSMGCCGDADIEVRGAGGGDGGDRLVVLVMTGDGGRWMSLFCWVC